MREPRKTVHTEQPIEPEKPAVRSSKLVAERKRLYDEAIERENEQRTEINKMRRWLTVLCNRRRDRKREYEAALSATTGVSHPETKPASHAALVSRLCDRIGSDEMERLLTEIEEHLGHTQNKQKLKKRASNLNVFDSTDSAQFAGG